MVLSIKPYESKLSWTKRERELPLAEAARTIRQVAATTINTSTIAAATTAVLESYLGISLNNA
jgi:hypothetical protein